MYVDDLSKTCEFSFVIYSIVFFFLLVIVANEIVERRNVTDTHRSLRFAFHTASRSRIRTAYFSFLFFFLCFTRFRFRFCFCSVVASSAFCVLPLLFRPPASASSTPAVTRQYTYVTYYWAKHDVGEYQRDQQLLYYLIKCDHRVSYLLYDATAVCEFICFRLLFHCNNSQFIGTYRKRKEKAKNSCAQRCYLCCQSIAQQGATIRVSVP